LLFIITEALVGAGLVLFEWVASDISSGRVISMAIHLINTFLLLAAITLTAWWVQKGSALDLSKNKALSAAFVIGFFGVLVIGVSGAVNALGDTLFPVESISAGIEQDFNPTAHLLLRLRIWHPIVAILVGFYLLLISGLLAMFQSEKLVRVFAITLSTLIIVQLIAGMINLLLLAPIFMQIVHLFLADLVWICLVLLFAVVFSLNGSSHSMMKAQSK
jgi:heme A synthase